MKSVDDVEFKKVCEIIEKLVELDVSMVLGDIITMLCFNIDEATDLVLGQYSGVLEDDW